MRATEHLIRDPEQQAVALLGAQQPRLGAREEGAHVGVCSDADHGGSVNRPAARPVRFVAPRSSHDEANLLCSVSTVTFPSVVALEDGRCRSVGEWRKLRA